MPAMVSKSEVIRLIERIEPKYRMPAKYGAGLRLEEVNNIDCSQLTLRQGQRGKDRVSIIPEGLKPAILEQLDYSRKLYQDDCINDANGVSLPNALER